MVSFEFIALVFTGLSITASLFYYANVLSNTNKTQKMQLETRQAQLFMQLVNRYRDDTKDLDIDKSLLYVEIESFEDCARALHFKTHKKRIIHNEHRLNIFLQQFSRYNIVYIPS